MIEGVVVQELTQIIDTRGRVMHMLRADNPLFDRFGEIYFSEVLAGVVKAWKKHRRMTQLFAVPVGMIRLVIYDDREGSKSNGKVAVFEVGREQYQLIRIPPMLWYGFKCISDQPALLANCADLLHDPGEGTHRELNDPLIPYQW
ncbi:MAG: dTDP-4-dehydrorhamnose 3,5-epimerase family protein [bacterium]